jgi:pimeloyl-ACP methyl ester carboxylesterase
VLEDIHVDANSVSFALPKQVGARLEGKVGSGGDVACVFHQAGLEMPCSMKAVDEQRFSELTTVLRPQTPTPPFPYDSTEVQFDSLDSGVRLAGTLTLPKGTGKVPVVLLISGSGAQDRDETIAGHKPFLVLADHLTRAGIAVLRVDDRGVGGSSAKGLESATTHDFALDARGGVRFLEGHARIDPARIGLLGHSEGGIVATLAVAEEPRIKFIVLLASTGVPGETIIVEQVRLGAMAAGAPKAVADAAAREQATVLKAALEAGRSADPEQALLEHLRRKPPSSMAGLPAKQREVALTSTAKVMASPWYQTFLTLDPAEPLAKVQCPVLALAGSKDTQVPPDMNLAAIEQALARAGNDDVTARRLQGLNHLFQHATTGSVAEYGSIDETLAPEALETIEGWISARVNG